MTAQPQPIGEELRRAREDAGLDLADVAAHLRIRSNFLSALEESRPDALPGITYGIGYVRTYAAFLGLEPDAAVRRFKEEAAGLNAKPQLVFPSPAPEGRVPGLVLMLVAAMLAGGAYGGWYWLSERDGNLRDLVPAVPERLAQLIEGEAPSLPALSTEPRSVAAKGSYAEANPTGAPASPSAASPSAASPGTSANVAPSPASSAPTSTASLSQQPLSSAPAPTAPAKAIVAPAPLDPAPQTPAAAALRSAPSGPRVATPEIAAAPPSAPRPVASEPRPSADTTTADRVASVGTVPSTAAPTGTAAPATTAASPTATEDTPDVTAPPEPATTAGTGDVGGTDTSTAATPEPVAAPTADAPATPTVPVDVGADVPAAPRIAAFIGASEAAVPAGRTTAGPVDRVMIRATGDSWVQVRDAQGTALFTRVLREGDVYRVPDQAGLRLATGNAGALQVLVDGDPAPSLGGFGEVVRNIALDPARLAAGTAIGASR